MSCFDNVRRDIDGCDTRHHRSGCLVAYICQGIQYSVQSNAITKPMEHQKVIIHVKIPFRTFAYPNIAMTTDTTKMNRLWIHHLQKEPSRCGRLSLDSADIYDREGILKTHQQSPVVVA